LNFASGVKVHGVPTQFVRKNRKLLLISFTNCTVTLHDELLFDPNWGSYDLAIGERISSVFAGAADSEQYYADLEAVETKPFFSRKLTLLEQLYGKVRNIREKSNIVSQKDELSGVIESLTNDFPHDWLLRIEVIELLEKHNLLPEEKTLLKEQLEKIKHLDEEFPVLIERGLMLAPY
jgi:phenylalanine-4-hydroxylase